MDINKIYENITELQTEIENMNESFKELAIMIKEEADPLGIKSHAEERKELTRDNYEKIKREYNNKEQEVRRLKKAVNVTGKPEIEDNYKMQVQNKNILAAKKSNAWQDKVEASREAKNESYLLEDDQAEQNARQRLTGLRNRLGLIKQQINRLSDEGKFKGDIKHKLSAEREKISMEIFKANEALEKASERIVSSSNIYDKKEPENDENKTEVVNESLEYDNLLKMSEAINFCQSCEIGRVLSDGNITDISDPNGITQSAEEFQQSQVGTLIEHALYYQSILPNGAFIVYGLIDGNEPMLSYVYKEGEQFKVIDPTYGASIDDRYFGKNYIVKPGLRSAVSLYSQNIEGKYQVFDNIDFLVGQPIGYYNSLIAKNWENGLYKSTPPVFEPTEFELQQQELSNQEEQLPEDAEMQPDEPQMAGQNEEIPEEAQSEEQNTQMQGEEIPEEEVQQLYNASDAVPVENTEEQINDNLDEPESELNMYGQSINQKIQEAVNGIAPVPRPGFALNSTSEGQKSAININREKVIEKKQENLNKSIESDEERKEDVQENIDNIQQQLKFNNNPANAESVQSRIEGLERQKANIDEEISKQKEQKQELAEDKRKLTEAKSPVELAFSGTTGAIISYLLTGQSTGNEQDNYVADKLKEMAVIRNILYKYDRELKKIEPDHTIISNLKLKLKQEINRFKKSH